MNTVPIRTGEDLARCVAQSGQPYHGQYFAMYSSLWRAIVTDPRWMLLPVDDHMVHRGDGVFETLKVTGGALYNLPAHVQRLERSARQLGLAVPVSGEELAGLVVQTVRAGGQPEALVRILLSRGPGSFGISPRDCPEPALYIIAYAASPPFMEAHPGGARVIRSRQPPKPPFYAAIKTVNYLPNVLMKMEALAAGADFVLTFDEQDHLAEGATENAGIVTAEGVLQFPRSNRLLPGTTAQRVVELARECVGRGGLKGIEEVPVPYAAVRAAAELLIFGTTPDVTAAVEFDRQPVGEARPGPVFHVLHRALAADIRGPSSRRTIVFGGGPAGGGGCASR